MGEDHKNECCGEKTRSPKMQNALIIGFPLRGEWIAPNTPGKMIPSHGTEQLGQRYAFDFLQVNRNKKGMHFFNASKLRYYLLGVPLNKCLCWGQEVFSPFDGQVIEVVDGYKERSIVHLISDLFVVVKNSLTFNPEKTRLETVLGNYIIMQYHQDVFALFAHLQKNSITVSDNQRVRKGEILGKVGHSGNSTAPHLHFQLMDKSRLLEAKGIPCVFEQYEVFKEGKWRSAHKDVPSEKDLIRL